MSEEELCFSSIDAPSAFDFESVLTAPVTHEGEEDQPPLCDTIWDSDDETRAFFRTNDAESEKRHPSREQNPDPTGKQLRSARPPRYTNRPTLSFEDFLRRFQLSNKSASLSPSSKLRVSGNEENIAPANSLIPKRSCTPSRRKASSTHNALWRPPVRKLTSSGAQPLTCARSAKPTEKSVPPPIPHGERTPVESSAQGVALQSSRDESSDHPPADASAQMNISNDNTPGTAMIFKKLGSDVVRIPRRAQQLQGPQVQRRHRKHQQQRRQPKQQPRKQPEEMQHQNKLLQQQLQDKSQQQQQQKRNAPTTENAPVGTENAPLRRPICSQRAKSFGDPMVANVPETPSLCPTTKTRAQRVPRKMAPRSKSARVLTTTQAKTIAASGELGRRDEKSNAAKKDSEQELSLTPILQERNNQVLRERNRRRSERQRSVRLQKEEALKTFENQLGRETKTASVAFTSITARPRQKARGQPLAELQTDGSGRAGISKQRKDGSIASRRGLTGLRGQTKRLNGRAALSSSGKKNGKSAISNAAKPKSAPKPQEESDDLQSILSQHNQRVEGRRHFRVATNV